MCKMLHDSPRGSGNPTTPMEGTDVPNHSAHNLAQLPSLPPEPWGDKLRRARGRLTQPQAAELAGRYIAQPDAATISRLEKRDAVPADRRRRNLAYILCLVYGVSPTDLDVGPDDAPSAMVIDLRDLRREADRISRSRWSAPFGCIGAACEAVAA